VAATGHAHTRAGRVKGRGAAWVAWSMAALTVAFTLLHLTLWTLADSVPDAVDSRGEAGPPIAFAVVGALILTRQPHNRIGWLFCAFGFSGSLNGALDAYALYGLAARPDAGLPDATAAAWVASWSWAPAFFLSLMLLPLLFPTGRLPSRRWRPVAWLIVLSILLAMISSAFRPGPLKRARFRWPPTRWASGAPPGSLRSWRSSVWCCLCRCSSLRWRRCWCGFGAPAGWSASS
jgi:hypothetical protein